MYKITETVAAELNYLELESPDGQSKAKICLNQGGSLSKFVFETIQILADYNSTSYLDIYASSILFPFANRIKDGDTPYNNLKYKFQCNEIDKNNALHGFVYNKPFDVIEKLKPRKEPFVQEYTKQADISPWKYTKQASIAICIIVIGVYIYFA